MARVVSIFISYRREDSAGHAGHLLDGLRGHFGRGQVFMDIDNIAPGMDFVEAIERAVTSCDVLLALIGSHWLKSSDDQGTRRLDKPNDWIRLEVATALARNIRVIPVLVQGAAMPRETDLPAELRPLTRRNAIELSDARWEYDLGRLIQALDSALGPGRSTTRRSSVARTSFVARPWVRWLALALLVGGTLAAGGLATLSGAVGRPGTVSASALPADGISPQCGSDVGASAPATQVSRTADGTLESNVQGIFRDLPQDASAVFVNLAGPERVELNPTTTVSAASTIKVPLMIEVMKQANEGKIKLDERQTVTQDKIVGGTGVLQLHPGVNVTITQLLQTTLVYSDNTGGNMLIKLVGTENVNRTMRQMGFDGTQLRRAFMDLTAPPDLNNVTTTGDMARMFQQLYERTLLPDPSSNQEMLRILRCRGQMTQPELDFMGRSLMPRPVLEHVNGILPGVRNDVSIVEQGDRPFVLAISLQHQSDEAAA
ncbi:MAG: serine hydrolase, partial [Chloroflexi bacterium]|nr:serine hydrolase [Chloroflexota bacterium]